MRSAADLFLDILKDSIIMTGPSIMFSRLAQNLGSGVHPLTSWISSSDIHGENILPIFTGGTNKHIAAVAANNLSKAYFLFLFHSYIRFQLFSWEFF